MIFRYCSYYLLAEIGPLDPAIWSFVDVYEFLIRAWHLLLQLKFKVFSLRNSTASKFTTLSLCIQDIFRWVMQQLLCSICSKSFLAFLLMEHSPKSVKVAWTWICPRGNWHLGQQDWHRIIRQRFCFLPLVYYELWGWRRLQSDTREFYLRVLGASWVSSGGGAPSWCPLGEWCGVVKNFSPLKMSTFPPGFYFWPS